MGPAEAKNKCIDNSDGTCSVEYIAPVPGEYTIGICYGKDDDKQHIPGSFEKKLLPYESHGSPFRVIADMPKDPSRVAGPDSRPRDCVLKEGAVPKQYELRWPTDMAGNYTADIFINGEKVDPPVTVFAKKSGHKNDVKLTGELKIL
ncbi:hypothetical protein TELCIR_06861 [Teladorsagia circumcincta]|uniref:Filamin/ABP280 repeat protein n=1 Tax=Teladorsagia circumcincta TaxID=45464 RepID=A0A2G9U7Y9_TELCI|nr:hypothetical protein TELCIR_11928 [Teladorsagia circumcincta]PIO71244.1 hypothetical protein TELCIR_06861 [Teladorsagia circumcincta]